MSSDYYFQKWKTVLIQLKTLIQIDQEYQTSKAHDKRHCEAVERQSGMLAAYLAVYNDVLDCSQQNLQVQKTKDIRNVLQAVVDRIHELKHGLRKLEKSEAQFLSKGAIQNHLTVDDAECHDIPFRVVRDEQYEHVETLVADAFTAAKEKIKERELELANGEEENPETEATVAWWEADDADVADDDDAPTGDKFMRYNEVEELSEETLKIRGLVALIQAHERNRQVTKSNFFRIQKRKMWEKALLGTLAPQAKPELRERAAQLIQKVARIFMELKRKKLRECRTNDLLGILHCNKPDYSQRNKAEQDKERRAAMFKQFDREWKTQSVKIKEEFLKRKHGEICEHYRDSIRDWFQEWYEKIGLFHNIPHVSNGGAVAIWRGETPSPEDWYEQYKEYIAEKQRNKNRTSHQAKFEKKAALMEQNKLKLEEQRKKKLEEQLKRKIMKNPNMHPGYHYPESKKFHKLIEALDQYHETWDDLDADESIKVKERNVRQLDEENIYAEVKLEIATDVEEDMKAELKKLNIALKKDYENAEEQMPEPMLEKKKRRAKNKLHHHKHPKVPDNKVVLEKLEYLAENGFLKEYPRTKLADFIGDHNITGDDRRCFNEKANLFAGEVRNIWWERCVEVTHGFHRILAVGPAGSGRTTLVHAMATANDAVLIELDPGALDIDFVTPVYLQMVVNAVAICARAAQPAVIYIRNVHLLYYKKNNPNGAFPNAELIKRYFIKRLFKHINKDDNVTVVATCSNPWLTTAKLLKQFPEVILLPDTSYSVVVQLLNNWVASNRCLPRDLDVHSLGRALRGYSFSFLKDTLEHFLQPNHVVKMAAYGLSAKLIVDYVMQTGVEKHDYGKYLKWHANKTVWGKKEQKHLQEAREFREAEKRHAEQLAKKKKKGRELQ